MRQRVHLITLGVEDLARAAAFYEALGWTRVPDAPPGIAVFDLPGASLALYPRADLERDIGRPLAPGSGSVTLACNQPDRAGVDAATEAARAAGAAILRAPHEVFRGGYLAYVADPDGHVWEFAFNPHAPLSPEGAFRWAGHGGDDA